MSAYISYPDRGRGAWPAAGGAGGTLNNDGTEPGPFYRSAVGRPPVGLTAYRADRDSTTVSVDDYATWRAVLAVQTQLAALDYRGGDLRPLVVDGIWGKNTDAAVRSFQVTGGLTPDGVFGPASSRALFVPLAKAVAARHDPQVWQIMLGTVTHESGWDPGAVGSSTPMDLGLGQINGPAHPSLTPDARLDPRIALPFVADLIAYNLRAMNGVVGDAVAAYRYGAGGARLWVAAGRPQTWKNTDAWDYIDTILSGGNA